MRRRLRVLTAIVLWGATSIACGSDAHDGASSAAFCAGADRLFNKGTFASDGGGVVDALRSLDVAGLPGDYQERVSTAIDIVEANIASFGLGQAPDGWSTEPVATVAARLCGADMSSFSAVP